MFSWIKLQYNHSLGFEAYFKLYTSNYLPWKVLPSSYAIVKCVYMCIYIKNLQLSSFSLSNFFYHSTECSVIGWCRSTSCWSCSISYLQFFFSLLPAYHKRDPCWYLLWKRKKEASVWLTNTWFWKQKLLFSLPCDSTLLRWIADFWAPQTLL